MSVFQSEDRLRLKRVRTEKAIQLAMQNRWEEAATLNREMLELFPKDVAKLTAGDQLQLDVTGSVVKVLDLAGHVIGQVEPKLAQRVVRLVEMGNRYSAAVTAAEDQFVRVILRETHRDPSMGSRP